MMGSVSGSGHSTLLRKLPGLMMLRPVGSVARRPKSISLKATRARNQGGSLKSVAQKRVSKAIPEEVQPNRNQNFGLVNGGVDDAHYSSLCFMEEKPPMSESGYANAFATSGSADGAKPFASADNGHVLFSSDQGSNSFDCSDFPWGDYGSRTPDVSSVLSATLETDGST
ncbi:hypothetical protein MLD38_004787 [Melastoma candidum]|uniref:Uncharacterized protein n=1 Tax=Melastoma candidum TaxID=119954 RepID=A0ACB9S622_9MYRT|nr:hypothetical protein MLD38_004787 [Melastoma candidum]